MPQRDVCVDLLRRQVSAARTFHVWAILFFKLEDGTVAVRSTLLGVP